MFIKTALVLIILLVFAYSAPNDPDLWWHISYGKNILENLAIPYTDTFSYTMYGYYWANSYTLAQIIIYTLYKMGGFIFLSFVFSFIVILALCLITRPFFKSSKLSGILVIAILSYFIIRGIRPLSLSSLYMLYLWYTLTLRNKSKRIYILPFLFFLWANTHADFIIGLSVFIFFIFVNFVKAKSRNTLIYIVIFALSVAATLINPYFYNLHLTLLNEVFSMSWQTKYIQEWSGALSYFNFEVASLLTYLMVPPIFILISLFAKKSKYKVSEPYIYSRIIETREFITAVFIVTLFMTLNSIYFFRHLLIFSSPLLYIFFYELLKWLPSFKFHPVIKNGFKLLVVLLLLNFSIKFINNIYYSQNFYKISEKYSYPYSAVQFLKKEKLTGNLLNEYGWGGYLIYTLPEYKTFIDGRMPAWKEEGRRYVFKDFIQIFYKKDKKETEKLINYYDFELALLKSDTSLSIQLKKDFGWKVLYKDNISTVLKRPY